MTDKPEKSPGEASREGLEMFDEHAHPHHETTRDDATQSKHPQKPLLHSPGDVHRGGPLPDQKK